VVEKMTLEIAQLKRANNIHSVPLVQIPIKEKKPGFFGFFKKTERQRISDSDEIREYYAKKLKENASSNVLHYEPENLNENPVVEPPVVKVSSEKIKENPEKTKDNNVDDALNKTKNLLSEGDVLEASGMIKQLKKRLK
jgi:hypothetical protein